MRIVTLNGEDWTMLMRAALAGDESAYATLLRSISGALRVFARNGLARAGAGSSDAEDVVQETLLAIHMKRHTWETGEPLRPWVYAIARHKLIDHLRRSGRRLTIDITGFAETLAADTPEEGASDAEVARALATLTPRERDVVQAIAVSGHSIRETADRLAINEGAVRVALHRGLASLARTFGKERP